MKAASCAVTPISEQGNYHARNAKLYTDFGLPCDAAIGQDVRTVFQQLTSLGQPGRLKHLLQSPFTLHATLLKWIGRRETDRARRANLPTSLPR